jgi:Flp pilus assembly protein CpaB
MAELPDLTSRLRRFHRRHRRLATAGMATIVVVSVVHVVAPSAPRTAPLVVAAHDLDSGRVIARDDLRMVDVAPDVVPAGAITAVAGAVGRTVAGPMRTGEPLTDARVLGTALIAGYPAGLVAAPVRIQDGDVVSLLRVGDRIDVYASDGNQRVPAPLVVSNAQVVALPTSADAEGALVVLAVTSVDAARLAQASATTRLSVSLRG